MDVDTEEILCFVELPGCHLDSALALHPLRDVPNNGWYVACRENITFYILTLLHFAVTDGQLCRACGTGSLKTDRENLAFAI